MQLDLGAQTPLGQIQPKFMPGGISKLFFGGLPVMQDTLDAAQADAESVVVDRLSSLLFVCGIDSQFLDNCRNGRSELCFSCVLVRATCMCHPGNSNKAKERRLIICKNLKSSSVPWTRRSPPWEKSQDVFCLGLTLHEPGRLQEGDGTISEEKLITLFENPKVAEGQG